MFGFALNKIKLSIVAFVCILPLGACLQNPALDVGQVKKPIKTIDVEQLLGVEGHWNLVEQSKSYDPAEAHLQARKKVNVNRRGKKSDLSAHFKPDAKSGQDGKLRVLRLEPQKGGFADTTPNYKVAGSSITKPNSMVADKKLLKVISAFLSSDESRGDGFVNGAIIIPPSLPNRKKSKDLLAPISDIVIPKIKPIRGSLVTPEEGNISGIIIPKIKPNINPNINPNIKSRVIKLRTGLYSGNVRIVIEVSHTTKYKVAIDGLRNVFRVKMENTNWDIAPQGSLRGSDLLGTYIARDQKDGFVLLEMRLKGKAEIVKTMVLRPSAGFGYRLVIDLKAL